MYLIIYESPVPTRTSETEKISFLSGPHPLYVRVRSNPSPSRWSYRARGSFPLPLVESSLPHPRPPWVFRATLQVSSPVGREFAASPSPLAPLRTSLPGDRAAGH
nr:hypothetical protein Q903MT_gene446 [Picea sitchensis]